MKYNITTLKKEVPKHIRLEVYKEALNQIDRLNDEGLCLALPKIMLGLTEMTWLSDTIDSKTKRGMQYRDTTIAFPELTYTVIQDIEGSKINNKRIQYLEQWIKELEGHKEQNNTEK